MAAKGMVFIGGGRAASTLLDMFQNNEEYRVIGVVDPNRNAEGMIRAVALGVETGSDMAAMIARRNVNVVVELTGNDRVRQMALELLRPDQNVITAGGARILVDMVQRQLKYQEMFKELMVRIESSIAEIDKSADQTQDVLGDFKILALNAQIVASKIGSGGAAFGAVVEQMKELIGNIETLVSDIHGTSDESNKVLTMLKSAEVKL